MKYLVVVNDLNFWKSQGINTSFESHKGWTSPLNPIKDEDTSLESHRRWRNTFLDTRRNEYLIWIKQRMIILWIQQRINKLTNLSRQQHLITQESYFIRFKPLIRTGLTKACDKIISQSSFCTWKYRALFN